MVMQSRADETVKKYLRAFQRWETWASGHSLVSLLAKDYQVALYLQHLGDTTIISQRKQSRRPAIYWHGSIPHQVYHPNIMSISANNLGRVAKDIS